jgi:hypothetical protein
LTALIDICPTQPEQYENVSEWVYVSWEVNQSAQVTRSTHEDTIMRI